MALQCNCAPRTLRGPSFSVQPFKAGRPGINQRIGAAKRDDGFVSLLQKLSGRPAASSSNSSSDSRPQQPWQQLVALASTSNTTISSSSSSSGATTTSTSLVRPQQQQQQQQQQLPALPQEQQSQQAAPSQAWLAGAALAFAVAAALLPAAAAHADTAQLAAAFESVRIPGIVGDDQFSEGLVSGFLLIFFSEIGDKTFFIALLLALREDRTAVFTGTFGALAVMTVISVGLGQAFHQLDELLPDLGVPLDDLLAVALLTWFGLTTLQGAAAASAKAAEEKEEAGEAVTELAAAGAGAAGALVLSTFSLVFAAEWGDKSFLATIALAAASDPAGVISGAVLGHGLATGIAVAGGSLLSNFISEVTAQYIGGSLFLVFAAATVYDIATGSH